MNTLKTVIFGIFCTIITATAVSQNDSLLVKHALYVNTIDNDSLKNYLDKKIDESQFILLGESHGIIEVGEITNYLYSIAQPKGFNTLCIETDPFAAKTIMDFYASGNSLDNAKALFKKYPFSIPFYDNMEDFKLFDNVIQRNGRLWGIDQSLMSQFRMGFEYIAQHTKNPILKALALQEQQKADMGYKKAVNSKDFMLAYIFQFDETLYQQMKSLSSLEEITNILDDLWKTKEIYGYQFSGQYYYNNETRAQLMKSNFMDYYTNAKMDHPKVIFKLGYNHAGRGLTFTNVYDIGNMAYELANSQGKQSLHILATGVSGVMNRANPMEPDKATIEITKGKYLPDAFYDLANISEKKYTIIKTEKLRSYAHKFSKEVQKFLFKFDLIILIKEAKPLTSF